MTTVNHDVLAARVVLGWLVEPGNKQLHQLVAAEGPVGALERVASGRVKGTLAAAAAVRLGDSDPARAAARLLERADRLGVRIVVPESPQWPSALDDLVHISVDGRDRFDRDTFPPQALWLRGGADLGQLAQRSVALVGARAASDYGCHVAADLAFTIASRGWTVVSGGAVGIDAAAHRGALAAAGNTVAVLAGGVDKPYPPGNMGLFEHVAQAGLVISEWPPGTDPHRHRFLIRNRVIAALTRGTVLVEAAARSGARFTLRRAKQLGRAAMAVPGRVTSAQSIGCHEELRSDDDPPVRLVYHADHVLEAIGAIGDDLAPVPVGREHPQDGLSDSEQRLVDGTPLRGGLTVEEIAARAGVGLLEALAKLPSLELRGYLKVLGDGTYAVNP